MDKDRTSTEEVAAAQQVLGTALAETPLVAPAPPSIQSTKPSFVKSKIGLLALVVGALLILGGGSAAAYYAVIVPNKPENVLMKSVLNLFDETKPKAGRYSGEVKVSSKAGSRTKLPAINTTFDGEVSDNSFSLNIAADVYGLKPKISVLSTDGKSLYFKLAGLKDILAKYSSLLPVENLSQATTIVNKLDGQWYDVSEDLIKSIPGTSGVNATDVASMKLSKEDLAKLGDLYQKHPFIKSAEKLADESIDGKSAFHFKVMFDKTEASAFIGDLKTAKLKILEKAKDSDFDDLKASVETYDWTKYPLDVWIDKSSKQLAKIEYAHDYTVENETMVGVSLTLKDIGKGITISKPAGAKSVLELKDDFAPFFERSNTINKKGTTEQQSSGLSLPSTLSNIFSN